MSDSKDSVDCSFIFDVIILINEQILTSFNKFGTVEKVLQSTIFSLYIFRVQNFEENMKNMTKKQLFIESFYRPRFILHDRRLLNLLLISKIYRFKD